MAEPRPLTDCPPSIWREAVAPYTKASARRSLLQVGVTFVGFLLIMAAMFYVLGHGILIGLLIAPVAAAFVVRLFIIQHDCGHQSFFGQAWANEALGRALGVLTLTPFDSWRWSHSMHHATSGNLDRRGFGDIATLTVREYRALPTWRKASYQLYRHPIVMLGFGPMLQFFVIHRLPVSQRFRKLREWASVCGTNAAILAVVVIAIMTLGWKLFLIGYLPVMVMAASIGVFLFYVQHQFEEAYWRPGTGWNYTAAALDGCSFLDLPVWLHWVTGYIGFHHIHHLSSRIPNYRLRECHNKNPILHSAKKLTLLESLKCLRLTLWDEDAGRLVRFDQA